MQLIKIAITSFIIELIGLLCFANGAELKTSQESNRVAIVVNKYLKQEIEDNLNIYLQDLKNEGYEPILKEWDLENDPTPRALKRYLKELYLEDKGLQGAVFIGDLPIPLVEIDSLITKKWWSNLTADYIAERYYMDLTGKNWTDKDKNYKFEELDYESHWKASGNYTPETLKRIFEEKNWAPIPEIWTSKIITSTLTGLFKKSERELVNKYLENNHAYRTGLIVFQKQNLVYSLPETIKGLDRVAFPEKEFEKAKSIMSHNYVLKEPLPPPSRVDEFFEPLNKESYEMLYWGRHGMKTDIDLGAEKLTSEMLANALINIKTAFVFPSSCWIGHYTEPAYFAGSYIFNELFSVLGILAATLPSIAGPETLTMSKFVKGDNLGLAFKKGTGIPDLSLNLKIDDPTFFVIRQASLNSRYILGDGTLKLQSLESTIDKYNSNQQNIINNSQYNEEEIYNYIKSAKKDATEFDDIETINSLFKRALENQDVEMLEILAEKNANIMIQDEEGGTFLHLMASGRVKNLDTIRTLLKKGLDMRTENKLDKTPWDIAKENNYDIQMFEATIQSGTLEQIKYLIENGANVNGKNKDHYNIPPLPIAIERGDIPIIQTLINNGADVNAKVWLGNTSLHWASAENNTEIVKILIENGADINATNDQGLGPSDMTSNPEILEIFENALTSN